MRPTRLPEARVVRGGVAHLPHLVRRVYQKIKDVRILFGTGGYGVCVEVWVVFLWGLDLDCCVLQVVSMWHQNGVVCRACIIPYHHATRVSFVSLFFWCKKTLRERSITSN